MKSIGILVVSLLVTAMMFTGVALGAQTSFSLNVTGNSFTDVDLRMDTPMGLPYEMEEYSLDVFIVNGEDVAQSHHLDIDSGVEAETTLIADRSIVVWVDESVRRDVIGDTIVDENVSAAHCYSGSAGYSVVGSELNYESAAHVSGIGVDYAVTAAGNGNMRWVSEEYLASGEIVHYVDNNNESDTNEENGADANEEDIPMPGEGELSTFWTSMYAKEDVRATGVFEFEGSYHSEFSNFPAPAPDEEIGKLCPFSSGWE